MKNLLLTATAVGIMASPAVAEIKLAGTARMGVVHEGASTRFSSRVRIVFTATGETDGGLSFGAVVRADQSGQGGIANNDSTVFILGRFGKLVMGDVAGAVNALVGQVSGVGYGRNDSLQEIVIIGTRKTALYYEYTRGAITLGAGIGQMAPVGPLEPDNDTYNAAIRYTGQIFSVALGYESSEILQDAVHLGAVLTLGQTVIKARVTDYDIFPDIAYAVSVDVALGPSTITGFYTDFGSGFIRYGLGFAYDLGDGATLAGGVVESATPLGDSTRADLGVKFKF